MYIYNIVYTYMYLFIYDIQIVLLIKIQLWFHIGHWYFIICIQFFSKNIKTIGFSLMATLKLLSKFIKFV